MSLVLFDPNKQMDIFASIDMVEIQPERHHTIMMLKNRDLSCAKDSMLLSSYEQARNNDPY